MKVTIYVSDYAGRVIGVCLAEIGNHVVCMDVGEDTINRLNRNEIPIYDPASMTCPSGV